MLTDELKKKGQTLVDELSGVRKTVTQKWMAHYIAELMIVAESDEKSDIVIEAQKTCADLILKLWDTEREDAKLRIQYAIDDKFDEKYQKPGYVEQVKKLVETPNFINDLQEQIEVDVLLYHIDEVEGDLLRLKIINGVLARFEGDAMIEEVKKEIDEFLQIFKETKFNLRYIWQEADAISAEDTNGSNEFIEKRLTIIRNIRNDLINFKGS